jgi:hypothetical protein
MLADIHRPITSGQIIGPEIDASIITVVGCVEKVLIDFSDKYTNSEIKNEKGLTQKLLHMLTIHALREYHPFCFEKEYMEVPERGDSPQVDIAAISTLDEGIVIGAKAYEGESFFSMEAKRLAKLGSNRLMEYLIGRSEKGKYNSCGGVERFKQGIHGRKLDYGAIIGYVQDYDFVHWHGQLNSWIKELINKKIFSQVNWMPKDKLQKKHIKSKTARFLSVNSRKDDPITLFHLWARLN